MFERIIGFPEESVPVCVFIEQPLAGAGAILVCPRVGLPWSYHTAPGRFLGLGSPYGFL